MSIVSRFVYKILSLRRVAEIDTKSSQTVVFAFLGEFGYELLNWQGLVRQYSHKNPGKTIVCLSRSSCELLYTDHSMFIALDANDRYMKSVASGYFARIAEGRVNGFRDCLGARALRRSIMIQIRQELKTRKIKFIFSDKYRQVDGIKFGANRFCFGLDTEHATIYDGSNLKQNKYTQLRTKNKSTAGVEGDYIFVMTASRSQIVRDNKTLDIESILNALSSLGEVIVGEFKTVRTNETEPISHSNQQVRRHSISNLEEQVNLINFAKVCVFISEGDFRSHTYVPPMAGRDVFVIGSSGIYKNGDIEGWNRHVFNFGGQIIPLPVELIDPKSQSGYERLCNILSKEIIKAKTLA